MNNKALILDLVDWVARRPRTYTDVMQAWRTSCPRLPIWEDAVDLRLVARQFDSEAGAIVVATDAGLQLLVQERGAANGGGLESIAAH